MKDEEYAAFQDLYRSGTSGLANFAAGREHGCATCNSEHLSLDDFDWTPEEAEFSALPCDVCKRPLGGARYAAHYAAVLPADTSPEDDNIRHLSICADCREYAIQGYLA